MAVVHLNKDKEILEREAKEWVEKKREQNRKRAYKKLFETP